MSLTKYSIATIGLYGLVFFAPVLFVTSDYYAESVIFFYISGALLMTWLYFKQREPLSFEIKKTPWFKVIAFGLLGIIAAILLQNLAVSLESIFSEVTPSQNTENIIQTILQQPLFALAAMIGGPIMEEFVFRRALVGFLSKYINVWIAVFISALAFAFAHNDNHLLVYIFLGLFFSGLYAYTGKIWTSIITHVGMNTLVIIIQLIIHYGIVTIPD